MAYGDFNYNNDGHETETKRGLKTGLGLNINFSDSEEISAAKYNITIGLVLFWGFLMNYLVVRLVDPIPIIANGGMFIFFIIAYVVLVISGSYICKKSDSPMVSFIGYNMIVLPLGIIIAIVMVAFDQDSTIVNNAILVTGIVTVAMMICGSVMPNVFTGIISYITGTLLITVLVEFLISVITGQHFGFFDYLVAVLFCGYIGYDWGKAQEKYRSIDNAVDSAAELYLDIINLFLRVLQIMARNSGKRR